MSFLRFLGKIILTIIVVFATIGISFASLAIVLTAIVLHSVPQDTKKDNKYEVVYGDDESSNKLLSIPVSGVILGDENTSESPFSFIDSSTAYGYKIKKQLYDAAVDDSIKGVILEINSPGGTIFGARAIADGVTYYENKTKKPVYTFVNGLAASGAYWAASSTQKIIADYGSSVGSIGVISGPFKYYNTVLSEDGGALSGGVVTQSGIDTIYITAGKSKDFGNPYRKLTADEIKITQQGVDNEYANFVNYVSSHRSIAVDTIKNSIGAMVYDNATAKDYHLIDQTGNKEDAYDELAQKAHVGSDYEVVRESKPVKGLISDLLQSFGTTSTLKVQSPNKCYLSSMILAYHGDVSQLCQ